MTEYTSSIDLASRLIIKKGRFITHEWNGDAQPKDDSRPWDKAKAPTHSQSVKAVILNIASTKVNGTTILAKDKTVLLPAKGLLRIPSEKSRIFDGGWYAVINVDELRPGDEAVMYTLQIRQ